MAEDRLLEVFQDLHRDLTNVADALKQDRDGRGSSVLAQISTSPLLSIVGERFQSLLAKPPRKKESRDAVLSGKVELAGEEWSLNKDFQEIALQVADELDLDEIDAARLALQAQDDEEASGRSRKECAIIKFHQERKYMLSCMLLLVELAKEEEELLDIEGAGDDLGQLGQYVHHYIFRGNVPGLTKVIERFVPACIATLKELRSWLQKLVEHVNNQAVLGRALDGATQETADFSRVMLIQQHEMLAVVLCYAIEKHMANEGDFTEFVGEYRSLDKYDYSTIHLFPVLGTFITVFGSTEGSGSVEQARKLNTRLNHQNANATRMIPFIDATVRAWWIVEYSGWYMEDAAGSGLSGVDLGEEDQQRSKHFTEALKDGAFDFMLAVVADARASDWQDPLRQKIRNWAQKRTPALPPDSVPFSPALQERIAVKMDMFVDAFISNMPDVLRKLKIEEDEQRQTGQAQEQDIDLERFLLIIAYAYEGRPEAADNFWNDPESNLAGFLQWASRRSSTPLQTAFCEMLQCLSDDDRTATAAHEFLLDEGHQLRRPSSITWANIFKEMEFHINQIRNNPAGFVAAPPRGTKFNMDQAENEPEGTILQQGYLRLMMKLALHSEQARAFLLQQPNEKLVELLFQAISSAVKTEVRANAFGVLSALMTRKTLPQNQAMWRFTESCFTGFFISPTVSARTQGASAVQPPPSFYMEALFQEMSPSFDEAGAFIQFLTVLITLPENSSLLRDALPFPEDLGASSRTRPGIEPYIDFVLGHMFSTRGTEARDLVSQRLLRYYCLTFALACIDDFNEDLIVFGNESNLNVDAAIQSKDLETYVALHPFSRVMEWMYDSRFIKGILDTIHQDRSDIGKAAPDSPLILGVLRAVELLSKALDLQTTYLDLVKPITNPQNRPQSRSHFTPTSNGAYGSIEDGLMTSLTLISDLGGYCGIGQPDLTLGSLKLLEKVSASQKVISWQSGPSSQVSRNKAVVALEEHGDAKTIAGAFTAELRAPLDTTRRAESPEYQIKIYVLDFLYSCLKANPNRPTIAHLLLGLRCSANSVDVEPKSPFDEGTSLFHALLPMIFELPARNEEGHMVGWLICLQYKAMRVLKLLWTSPLSSNIILEELRENDFLFIMLLKHLVTDQNSRWDDQEPSGPDFLTTPAAQGFTDYLSMRTMALGYITRELCSVSHGQVPALKRRIFDALGGQIVVDGIESIPVPSVFEFHDSLPQEDLFAAPTLELRTLNNLDLKACQREDDDGNKVYDLTKVQEVILLKRNEGKNVGQVVLPQDNVQMELEEETLLLYVVYVNRLTQIRALSLKALTGWTKLLMVMTDCNEFKATNKVSFILQTLQATLPSLETYSSDTPSRAFELAKLVKVLLYKLDFASMSSTDKQSRAVENLISDKLFQLFQICLNAIAKWAGQQELRALYYSICHRYLSGLLDNDAGSLSGLRKAMKTIQVYGEKLLNVLCDDTFGGDAECQSSALIFLGALVRLSRHEKDSYVVEALNRLNFIGILVDFLKDLLQEWVESNRLGKSDYEFYLNSKLALLLQLCQTRGGAKYVLQANIFRAVDMSTIFSVDPELQVEPSDVKALERHYLLLVKVARIIGAAIISRGSHNILQGRRFLTDHRMLVMHILKRSAGIGNGAGRMDPKLADRIEDLAEAFMVIITATEFLEFENQTLTEQSTEAPRLFH
ncbi:nucleoporin Nup186/Nup192/Nup205 [Xylariaceae sp. FL0255]|nr:nucleoporin Nup186/Nup192/Nup205 [Xylariaceae sp. FL0255]